VLSICFSAFTVHVASLRDRQSFSNTHPINNSEHVERKFIGFFFSFAEMKNVKQYPGNVFQKSLWPPLCTHTFLK
jgi:hypothetical protein